MNLHQHLANYALGHVGDSQLIDIALAALEEGYESEHLYLLAGENPDDHNRFEVHQYFTLALEEVEAEIPTKIEAAKILIKYWVGEIAGHAIPAQEGAEKIISEVYYQFSSEELDEKIAGEYFGIQYLCGLNREYSDLQEPYIEYEGKNISLEEAEKILEEEIVKEATRLVAELDY